MELASSIEDLGRIYADFREAVREFRLRPALQARRYMLQSHVPLLLLIPIFAAACPYVWIFGSFSFSRQIILPLLTALGAAAFAAVNDKLFEHLKGIDLPRFKNSTLFLFLPVPGVGCFFILHPMLGFAMMLAAAAFSSLLAVRVHAETYHISYARSAAYLVSAAVFLFVPLLLLLGLFNLYRSAAIVLDFFG